MSDAGRIYDVAVVGGGINGCGIARDAAGRGYSVLLMEQGDLAGAASSASSKLLHADFHHLQRFAVRRVREALKERDVLLESAPHLVRPLRFVLPHDPRVRAWWRLRTGMFLHDRLGGRKLLPGSRILDLHQDMAGASLHPNFRFAFEYSDCWVDDARLVVANAVDAAERGADIRVRCRCLSARRRGKVWQLAAEDRRHGGKLQFQARALVNAAGPWAGGLLQRTPGAGARTPVRLVKGSHIVVPAKFRHGKPYVFQNKDRHICFAIPFDENFTLIGATEEAFKGNPSAVVVNASEIAYLCAAANAYLRDNVRPIDVVWAYSGVRPLYGDGLRLDAPAKGAPLLHVVGGTIVTYRRRAETALRMLGRALRQRTKPWTATAILPGGDMTWDGVTSFAVEVLGLYRFLSTGHVRRLVSTYGTRALDILEGVRSEADLGRHFGADLSEREVCYLMDYEWALTAEDVLWRRTKLGLRFSREQAMELEAWMAHRRGGAAPPDRQPAPLAENRKQN
ncbi:MAG: glycerol-3-phosphate dehydrogenase [Hyphomicrobiaceae bacterium]